MKITKREYAVFILTHGRAENVATYHSLRKCGYTGEIFLFIDDEDDQADLYRQNYGEENVLIFDKRAIAKTFDTADQSTNRTASVFARNASQIVAKEMGYKYIIQFDDDYGDFNHKFTNAKGILRGRPVQNFDAIFDILIDFLNDSNADSVAIGQGGDLLGGINNARWDQQLLRKAMNSFILRTDRPITFIGRLNEDVNAYVTYGSRGKLFLTTISVLVMPFNTQSLAGGITETYLESGTYIKSFFSLMMNPSSVVIAPMGLSRPRLHHRISWNNAVPKILSPQHKKAG
jgi:hypothetical protein